ncbi:hypothetical protein JD276_03390 [Leucobacter sp. CSA1]|uniref:DUF559 domain-containing protein n=1 Tax=Leucobacter chromiisoli TaxID=2796471 RepID=A0A934Q5L0_9MICO|nr:hypothetical protein [Leucobacter chromiisoli]MBK0418073.1 hypothetical protein [Leucobacter chromiisoli]
MFDDAGRLLGCSEIAFPEHLVAHEYEGDRHRTEPAQWNRDIRKYRDYGSAGWEVIRVTSQLLYVRANELREQTFDALRRHGWTPPGYSRGGGEIGDASVRFAVLKRT